jgi:hypothetical protein
MPPVTNGQSGQVLMIEACRFHSLTRRLEWMPLKTIGQMVSLEAKLLIVSDSVMGCLAVLEKRLLDSKACASSR